MSWTSIDDLLCDDHAYLFNLTIAEKIGVLDPTAAVYISHYYGPSFGLGDLYTLSMRDPMYATAKG